MLLTQSAFEHLLQSIQSHKTESAEIDCKEDLPLDSEGDKASFIRDVAALANNVADSYILIGIQDKTWKKIGLTKGSLLLDSDPTQSRMNQILGNKIDPQLSIRYQVFDLDNLKIGVVIINGQSAPYIVAIEDAQYGGAKTKGSNTFINRGVIYVRNGDTTAIANRQGRILRIITNVEQRKNNPAIDLPEQFLSQNKYTDIENADYGKNGLANSLIEYQMERTATGWSDKSVDAKSWVSFVYLPKIHGCIVDTASLLTKLQPGERIGRLGNWFHGLPRHISDMLFYAKGNPRIYSAKWSKTDKVSPDKYSAALEIYPNGAIHLVTTYPLFYERENIRFFAFVNLIGFFWQITYLARAIYSDSNYDGEVLFELNMVGTRGTKLADFAPDWKSPFDDLYSPNAHDIIQETNISVSRSLAITRANDEEIEHMIRDFAMEIGKYYGQDKPRCFTHDKNEFPVREYYQRNN